MFLCWPLQRPLFYNIVEKCTIHINGRRVGVTPYLTTTNKNTRNCTLRWTLEANSSNQNNWKMYRRIIQKCQWNSKFVEKEYSKLCNQSINLSFLLLQAIHQASAEFHQRKMPCPRTRSDRCVIFLSHPLIETSYPKK